MKAGNIVLGIVSLIFAAFAWMLLETGVFRSSPAAIESASLNLALAGGQPVLLEFYADWCGPCLMVAPDLEALTQEWTGKAQVIRVNVDKQQALTQQYGIKSIPAFVVFRKGKEVTRAAGGLSKDEIRRLMF